MIIGTAGHIDHGKTALVRALTGVETDRLKEEKARGITIDLGFAYAPGRDGGGKVGFVDVPGHERFVGTMLAGATGIDAVLLVVAADDGLMPQTLEHLDIVDLLGIETGIVALTKADLAGPDRRQEVSADIRDRLAATALAGLDIVPVSTVTGEGIEELRARLLALAPAARPAADRLFRMSVDRSFTLAGAGTVVTGTVMSGEVASGDRLVVSPRGLPVRVRSIHAQNRPAERGRAGDRCALNIAGDGVTREAIVRGDTICDPALHAPTDRIDAELRLLPGLARGVDTWFPVRLHHAATEIGARLIPLEGDDVPPGGSARVQIVLERPIAAAAGDRFVVRDTSARHTLGGGRFLDLRAPARKRRGPERLRQLDALAIADPAAAASGLLTLPPHWLDLDAFARDRALAPGARDGIARALGLVRFSAAGRAIVLAPERADALGREVELILEAFHEREPDLQGMGLEALRQRAGLRLAAPAFRAWLDRMAEDGRIAVAGSWVRLAGHVARLGPADEALWDSIAPRLDGTLRFRPPRVRDLAGEFAEPEESLRILLKRVARQGRVDEVAHDHFFLRATVEEMAGIVRRLSAGTPDGWLTAAQFRDQVDNGRKVAIQILDFFDRHGVTVRRGDLRRSNRYRLDLFAPSGLGDTQAAADRQAG